MYSRQEATQLKQEFWTAFGQYIFPVLSADGEKINWINYKTGEKDIAFRMHADNKEAVIAIELHHKDPGIQQLFFEQFRQFKNQLEQELGEAWNWQLHIPNDHGRIISRISKTKTQVSIFKREDWPELISFFKPRIMALDAFWSSVRYGFEALH